MKRIVLLAAPVMLTVTFAANAGTLNNGSWSPNGCGVMPGGACCQFKQRDYH